MARSVFNDIHHLFFSHFTLLRSLDSTTLYCRCKGFNMDYNRNECQAVLENSQDNLFNLRPSTGIAFFEAICLRGRCRQNQTKHSIVFDRWTLLPLQEGEGGLSRDWEVSIVTCKNRGFRSAKLLLPETCHICPSYGHCPPTVDVCLYLQRDP
jgi:hypothetical protein